MIHRRSSNFSRPVWLLFLAYTLASLAHFVHNAEFIAFYPGMPVWITRETVYQAWLVVAGVGVLGLGLRYLGWPVLGALVIAAYGALGLDGLAHYTLGLCSEHTWLANLTIWAEALSGAALAVAAVVWARAQRAEQRGQARS
jgi:hypothetical protein